MSIKKPQSPHFRFYTEAELQQSISVRPFEKKLGESLHKATSWEQLEDQLKKSEVTYVLFGIAEDIGVRANWGIAGTSTAWSAFWHSFLNLSSNSFLEGTSIVMAGYFDFSDLQSQLPTATSRSLAEVEACRKLVPLIDEEVASLASWITSYKKIPIVIGGGHNNAYPLIKGTAQGLSRSDLSAEEKINVLNADAHADFRPVEGRHSGNPFRYAREEGWLNKYGVLGVMENYLTENVYQEL
ncbi:MAG: arginase family protein, partial [Chitinophagaceae bacterium]